MGIEPIRDSFIVGSLRYQKQIDSAPYLGAVCASIT